MGPTLNREIGSIPFPHHTWPQKLTGGWRRSWAGARQVVHRWEAFPTGGWLEGVMSGVLGVATKASGGQVWEKNGAKHPPRKPLPDYTRITRRLHARIVQNPVTVVKSIFSHPDYTRITRVLHAPFWQILYEFRHIFEEGSCFRGPDTLRGGPKRVPQDKDVDERRASKSIRAAAVPGQVRGVAARRECAAGLNGIGTES